MKECSLLSRQSHYFLAISLPNHMKEACTKIQKQFKEKLTIDSYKHWVSSEDFHLTLFFFGELSVNEKESVIHLLTEMEVRKKIKLSFNKTDTFGAKDSPRVVYLKPDRNSFLEHLYLEIKKSLEKKSFSITNKSFQPHVTLMKKCTSNWNQERRLDQFNQCFEKDIFPIEMAVCELTLYKVKVNSIPRYQRVYTFNLC